MRRGAETAGAPVVAVPSLRMHCKTQEQLDAYTAREAARLERDARSDLAAARGYRLGEGRATARVYAAELESVGHALASQAGAQGRGYDAVRDDSLFTDFPEPTQRDYDERSASDELTGGSR